MQSAEKIKVKSTKENWMKEESGLKCNTVRQLDGDGLDMIEIEDTETGYVFFTTYNRHNNMERKYNYFMET